MNQRTALEQDLVEFAKSIEEIFEKQMELQENLRKLLNSILERLRANQGMDELSLSQFGVNLDRLNGLGRKSLDERNLNCNTSAGLSI